MIEGIDYYRMVMSDPFSWLDLSEKIKYSSEIIHKQLQLLLQKHSDDRDFQTEQNIVALWYSYYLLSGYSFENLIKGLSIKNNSSLDDINSVFKLWKYNSGHGISKIAQDNISDLTKDEIFILEKLETYIVWAGKYNLPRSEKKYMNERNKHFYNSNDNLIINALYDRIRNLF